MNESTILRLAGMGITPYSARGLQQTLAPIDAAKQYRRTVNGKLVDLSDEAFRKYVSTITGSDQEPPAFGDRWPGMVLTVDCIAELSLLGVTTEEPTTEGTEQGFDRPFVPGSIRTADGFTFYRPRLVMVITDLTMNFNEWGAVTDWTLALEEQ